MPSPGQRGGSVRCGGTRPPPEGISERCRKGVFLEPTVITGLDARCRTNLEEIFGPVVTIMPMWPHGELVEIGEQLGLPPLE